MPKTSVVFFKDTDGSVPTKVWIDEVVAKRDRRITAKLQARINMLRADGRDLRRPVAGVLEDGIYELRPIWPCELSAAVFFCRRYSGCRVSRLHEGS